MWCNKLKMGRTTLLLLVTLTTYVGRVSGCTVAGVSNWWLDLSVVDIDRGVVFQGATTDISGIQLAEHSGDGLNSGPYLVATHADSTFTLALSDAFDRYEEDETSVSMSFSVTFTCSTGNSLPIVFIISVIDTNNNDPVFTAGNEITFTITPPLPPGYLVTGCVGGIDVRDIDLTTQSIEFAIEPNDYFEIAYDAASSTQAKNFAAVLRTTTFIRSLPDPVSLWISATDVDQTGDPPRTTSATLRVEAQGDFELPEEPAFSQVFYIATYSAEHQLSLEQPIYLARGYDDDVSFNLTGEYASYFQQLQQGNQVTINVTSPLPADVIAKGNLLLVVSAAMEYTSGATATIVVQLPEVLGLEFEEAHYEGTIVDDTLSLSQITLTQGYENGYELTISSQYASFFEASQQSNIITITKQPLDANIIEENTFLTLQLTAASNASLATALIFLEIIKNDTVTPLFEQRVYTGSYTAETGLDIGAITLYQGYDDTVSFYMQGDYESYFTLSENMNVLNLQLTSSLPEQVLEEQQQILLTIGALKPRTVGAHTAVSISLPTARQLSFEETSYTGTVEANTLTLESIVFSDGFTSDINFALSGDYASFFAVTHLENVVTIELSTPLTAPVIEGNNLLVLSLEATGANALRAIASIVLEIIKQDMVTPVFERNIYYGTYEETNTVVFENISLSQGYDNTVSFRIEGDHSQYFSVSNSENSVVLSLDADIPTEIIYSTKVLVFHIIADKPLTVGANAAVSIAFPQAMTEADILEFARHNYVGSLENVTLTLEDVILETGYAATTVFTLTGELSSYFTILNDGNVVSVSASSALPVDLIQSNAFIVLEIEAQRERAVAAHTTIIIEISQDPISAPVFDEAYYRGVYTGQSGLEFERIIYLQQGFDETVTFYLEGEFSEWFSLAQSGEGVSPTVTSEIPQDVLVTNRQLLFTVVANKTGTPAARAAISIDLPDEASGGVLRFAESSYVGRIESGALQVEPLLLLGENFEELDFEITGDYSSYFTLNQEGNSVTIELAGDLSPEIITSEAFLVLDLQVSREGWVSGFTTIVLEIVRPDQLTPVFNRAFYTGSFSSESGLTFEHTIQLVQGHDDTVEFTIEGDEGEWFEITWNGNSLTLSVIDEGPSQVADKTHLVFAVVANKTGTLPGRAGVIIYLTDTLEMETLQFSSPYYSGSIVNGSLSLEDINLAHGYSPDVNFTIAGDLAEFFEVSNEESAVSVQLLSELPSEITGNVLILTLEARSLTAVAYTTIVVELTRRVDIELIAPVFEEPFYSGAYAEIDGLSFDQQIRLIGGFDASVVFSLEGEQSAWFSLQQNDDTVTLQLLTTIPTDILESNRNLVFSVLARRDNLEGRTAIVIVLTEDALEMETLRFSSPYYSGSIVNGSLSLEDINLAHGYSPDVNFTIAGDLAEFFEVSNEESAVSVRLLSELPAEITGNVLILTLEARSLTAVAYTTIVVELTRRIDIELIAPVFEEPFYSGAYAEIDGLTFDQQIRLIGGFDASVVFSLEGEQSAWFTLQQNDDIVTLQLLTTIPTDILESNRNLVFSVLARRDDLVGRTAIMIALTEDSVSPTVLRFEQSYYMGQLQNDTINLNPIVVSEGYSEEITFTLRGDLAEYFQVTDVTGTINVVLNAPIPEDMLVISRIILLELEASAPQAIPASTTIVLDNSADDILTPLVFTEPYYTGAYGEHGLVFDSSIALINGNNGPVTYALEGDHIEWFTLEQAENVASLGLGNAIPVEVLSNNHNLIFTVTASMPGHSASRAAIIISLIDAEARTVLRFDEIHYLGSIESNELVLGAITLSEGYAEDVTFALYGELSSLFNIVTDGPNVGIELLAELPEESIPQSRLIVLELQATAPQAVSAFATVIFAVEAENEGDISSTLAFNEPYYTGHYTEADGLAFEAIVSLSDGYDENVTFALSGDYTQYFTLIQEENSILLTLLNPLPVEVLVNNERLIFIITAQKPGSNVATSAIIISLTYDPAAISVLMFERAIYLGSIENYTVITLDIIELTEGFSENVDFALEGELAHLFTLTSVGSNVTVFLVESLPEEAVPENRIILLQLQASGPHVIAAYTTIVFEVIENIDEENSTVLQFSEIYYTGSYNADNNSLVFEDNISLTQGYDENIYFELEGGSSQWFTFEQSGNSLTLVLLNAIPSEVLESNRKLVFTLRAQATDRNIARTVIVISLITTEDSTSISGALFESALYTGTIQFGEVSHETITVSGYNGTEIQILGANAALFEATLNAGLVTVQAANTLTLPEELTYVALELQAGDAGTALILDVHNADVPSVPTVAFSAASYEIRTDVSQAGQVGAVLATADNGEPIVYTLQTDNAHLLERLAVSESGSLHLSAPASSGVYTFSVVAATVTTQASASAPVRLIVDAIAICGDDDPYLVVSPLIVLDRDEEEEHSDLVLTNTTGCRFTLTNRWPADQDWLYVDERGLHARAIDREDPSIAFMALSQVQVELILECDNDEAATTRSKRSTEARLDSLGPYDYGNNKWLMADTILYNSRRSFVNLIVNDINDNYPIFVGSDTAPIAVGYPVPELLEVVPPRALVELKATDADVGVNAALLYWSSEPELAVSPYSGSIHVRDNERGLQDGRQLTVHATDRNGVGLTGNMTLVVRLLSVEHISVLTVRDAFLEDEQVILNNLTQAIGYDVRALTSTVISDEYEDISSRRQRQDTSRGASLRMYVFGLRNTVPVDVYELTSDINNNVIASVVVADSVSLQDYLESHEICVIPGRDIGLLAATIVLSVLLFILIVLIALWYFLKWRKERSYQEFSDQSSVASLNDSVIVIPKPDTLTRPRVNIEELKRSERRLQEMLDAAPVNDVVTEPSSTSSRTGPQDTAILDVPLPDINVPIVIQSIDKLKAAAEDEDEDEYGERKNNARRKSVVTFNENVEKIIHVEDRPDSDSEPDYEIERL